MTAQEPAPRPARRKQSASDESADTVAASSGPNGGGDSGKEIDKGGRPPGDAFALGWAMALVYGPIPRKQSETKKHLPTVNELAPEARLKVAFAEVKALAMPFVACHAEATAAEEAWNPTDSEPYHDKLRDLHYMFLETFVPFPDRLAAYQLGRALADTWWQPCREGSTSSDFLGQFNPFRLATLRAWMNEAAGILPPQSAAVAARSLQNWQDWADVNSGPLSRKWTAQRASVVAALRRQATAWHALLTATPGSSTPSVDAWIQAGESVLRSARAIGRRILTRFWPVVIVASAAIGGLMYLVITNTQGSTRAWSGLVTALGSVGVSTASIKSAAQKVAKGIEQEVWNSATLDARGWEVTWLPTTAQGLVRRYRLYRRNVARPQAKKGLERHEPGDDEQ